MVPQEKQKAIIINEQETDTAPLTAVPLPGPFKNTIIMRGG